ncbi:MAG: GTPase HflX, partial [Microbacterium sp.]
MTDTTTPQSTDETSVDPVDRVLSRAEARSGVRVFGAAQALQDEATVLRADSDGDQWDREDRASLRRVPGLSTELEDVTEVEYRQLRLENVVLVGVHPQGEQEDAENSLRELAALSETAGAIVMDAVL